MRTRHKAIASLAIAGILLFAPVACFAEQEESQASTQVTVDLSGLDRGDRHEPLAQTGDISPLATACVVAMGTTATCLGLHTKRNH